MEKTKKGKEVKISKTVNALARLTRAGDENSKSTQKLRDAVDIVCREIQDIMPENVLLPLNYGIQKTSTNSGGSALYLYAGCTVRNTYGGDMLEEGEIVNNDGGEYLYGDFNCWIEGASRETVLEFARDIAEGLLDKFADFLENRKKEEEKAVEQKLKR